MAAPLFVTDEATLKSRLRLSAVPASAADTEAIIDQAILDARVRFYRALGASRVAAILTTAFTETPTTDAQIVRALAFSTEVKMVRCILMRTLPNAFMDASGDVDARWNEEAPLREMGAEREEELARCEREVEAALLELEEPGLDNCSDVQMYDGTPDRQTSFPANTPRIGQTLRPRYRRYPSA
jgi:hypothetical protein